MGMSEPPEVVRAGIGERADGLYEGAGTGERAVHAVWTSETARASWPEGTGGWERVDVDAWAVARERAVRSACTDAPE
jgi:hypothetical protein